MAWKNNTLSDSKDQMSAFINSYLKHELAVIKTDQNSFKDEINDHLVKADKEVSKLRGRVGSIMEEKSSLLKKIKSLEVSNQKMQDEIVKLHKNNQQSNSTEAGSITSSLSRRQQSTKEEESPGATKSIPTSQHETPVELGNLEISSENMDLIEELVSMEEGSKNQNMNLEECKDNRDFPNYDYVMCDFNRTYLDTQGIIMIQNI